MRFTVVNANKINVTTKRAINKNEYQRNGCLCICEINQKATTEIETTSTIIQNDLMALSITQDIKWERIKTDVSNLIAVHLYEVNTILITCYMRPFNLEQQRIAYQQFETMEKLIRRFSQRNIIIMGDLNAIDELWSNMGNSNNAARSIKIGRTTRQIIEKNGLKIINNNKIATYTRGNNVIDLIIASQKIKVKWVRITKLALTDHKEVTAEIELRKTKKHLERTLKINSWKLNWESEASQEKEKRWTKKSKIIRMCNEIIHFPTNHGKWTLIEKTAALNKLSKSMALKLKEARTSKEIWKYIREYLGKKKTELNNDMEKSRDEQIKDFSFKKPIYRDIPSNIEGKMTKEEVDIVKNFKCNSSSLDADDFTRTTWKKFREKNQTEIQQTIRTIVKFSHIPEMVATLGCGFVPKKDGKVRVIKAANYLMKILDKIILNRLLGKIDELIDGKIQYAYMEARSRQDMIEDTIKEIRKMDSKDALIKIDLSKAFDKVNTQPAMDKIKRVCGESTYGLLSSIATSRWLKVSVNKKLRYKKETEGTPQGSAIGPIIFIIAINDTLRRIEGKTKMVKAFADDIVIITKDKEVTIREVMTEMKTVNLEINREKTEIYNLKEIKTKAPEILGEPICGLIGKGIAQYKKITKSIKGKMVKEWTSKPDLKYLPMKARLLIRSSVIIQKLKKGSLSYLLTAEDEEMKIRRLDVVIEEIFGTIKEIQSEKKHFSRKILLLEGHHKDIITLLKESSKTKENSERCTSQMRRDIIDRETYWVKKEKWIIIAKRTHDWHKFQIQKEKEKVEYTKIYAIKQVRSLQEIQAIALQIMVRMLERNNTEVTIMLTDEMERSIHTKSSFSKEIITTLSKIANKDWKWIRPDGKKRELIIAEEEEIERIDTIYKIKEERNQEANRIYKKWWSTKKSMWTDLYPEGKVKKTDRFYKLKEISNRMEKCICENKGWGMDHILRNCEKIKEKTEEYMKMKGQKQLPRNNEDWNIDHLNQTRWKITIEWMSYIRQIIETASRQEKSKNPQDNNIT